MDTTCEKHFADHERQLKKGGLKITRARLDLLDVLKHAKKPISIKQIAHQLGYADIVTLYRNIEALKNLGTVKQINLKDRQAYYELTEGPHHHHIICTKCGKLADIEIQEINLKQPFLKKHGFSKITDHNLEFFGICQSCQ